MARYINKTTGVIVDVTSTVEGNWEALDESPVSIVDEEITETPKKRKKTSIKEQ